MSTFFEMPTRRDYELRIAAPLGRLKQPGYCPLCGAMWTRYERQIEVAKEAPGWRGWPVEPPPEYVREFPVAVNRTLTCSNGHEHWFQTAPGEDGS